MPYKAELLKRHWGIVKANLVDIFANHSRDTTAHLSVRPWPRFVQKESLWAEGLVPGMITGYGSTVKITIDSKQLFPLAFDEEHGHLSHLFAGRLYKLDTGDRVETCLVSAVQADALEKSLYFVKFKRHMPGLISEVDIPCTIVGLLASPAYLKGYHVQLMMPTIKCEVAGDTVPPPFLINVSNLDYRQPYNSIYLKDIQHLLPEDQSVLFHRSYDLESQEVACTYHPSSLPQEPLPPDYIDPNFLNKRGKRIHLTYKGFFPKQ